MHNTNVDEIMNEHEHHDVKHNSTVDPKNTDTENATPCKTEDVDTNHNVPATPAYENDNNALPNPKGSSGNSHIDKEKPLPPAKMARYRITLDEKGGGAIFMEAVSGTVYKKFYFGTDDVLRKSKTVTLPVAVNGKVFDNTYDLFNDLVVNGKYRKV